MTDMFAKLAAPFSAERVSWRVGSTTADKKRGMALAYIDARDVMERLDAVCGPAGWQCDYPHATSKTVCRIGIKVGDEWIWKADGAGDTDVEAEKGALSDAFKRAAVRWAIGRYLYDIPSPWVELEAHGKSYAIPDAEKARLARMLANSASTASAPQPKAPAPVQTTPPPATAAKPTASSLTLFAKLSLDLNALASPQAVEEWMRNGGVGADFHDLPAPLQDDLRAAIKVRRKALAEKAPAE
jgi:hypothetical protein